MTQGQSLPPEDEDRGDGGEEVPQEGLRAQQPVHVHGRCYRDTQVLVEWGHLLREHHLKVPCKTHDVWSLIYSLCRGNCMLIAAWSRMKQAVSADLAQILVM